MTQKRDRHARENIDIREAASRRCKRCGALFSSSESAIEQATG